MDRVIIKLSEAQAKYVQTIRARNQQQIDNSILEGKSRMSSVLDMLLIAEGRQDKRAPDWKWSDDGESIYLDTPSPTDIVPTVNSSAPAADNPPISKLQPPPEGCEPVPEVGNETAAPKTMGTRLFNKSPFLVDGSIIEVEKV